MAESVIGRRGFKETQRLFERSQPGSKSIALRPKVSLRIGRTSAEHLTSKRSAIFGERAAMLIRLTSKALTWRIAISDIVFARHQIRTVPRLKVL
jgi:hypothetical protein